MSQMKIHKGEAYEGAPLTIRARVVNASGTAITQASVNALGVTYIVDQYNSEREAELDSDATSIITSTSAGAVSSVVFDTLQSWDVDDTGYNLAFTLPPASFPTGDKYVRVSVWIDPASGDDFPGVIGIFYVWPTTKD
jgi:hypothetical protein